MNILIMESPFISSFAGYSIFCLGPTIIYIPTDFVFSITSICVAEV